MAFIWRTGTRYISVGTFFCLLKSVQQIIIDATELLAEGADGEEGEEVKIECTASDVAHDIQGESQAGEAGAEEQEEDFEDDSVQAFGGHTGMEKILHRFA